VTILAPPPTNDAADDVPLRAEQDLRRAALETAGPAASSLALALILFRQFEFSGFFGFLLVWYLGFLVAYWLTVRELHGRQDVADRMASLLIGTGALLALLALIAIVYTVVTRGAPLIITSFPNFFTHTLAKVGPLDPPTEAGCFHAIVGTLEQVSISTIFVIPLSILTAVYLNEIGGGLERPVRFVVDAMSGVPSIVAGFFVYSFWVTGLEKHYSGIAGSMALIILMMPSVTRTAEEVLKIVHVGLREAGLALGAPEWRMILQIVLPTARTGLVTGAILGVARAVGETAPMLLTSYGSSVLNLNATDGPQSNLPTFVFALIRSNQKNQVDEAWAGALVLVGLVLGLFTLARMIAARGVGGRSQR
jgi:phosphate transport system permease protein